MEVIVFSGQQNFTKGVEKLIHDHPQYANCTVVEAVGAKLVEQADAYYAQGSKIFIARGFNYQRLKERYDIPLIQVRTTYEEILLSFEKAKEVSSHIAILGFGPIYDMILKFRKISQEDFLPLEVPDPKNREKIIREASAKGIDTFVGGLDSKRICEMVGVNHVMLDISPDSLTDALDEAEELLRTNFEKNRNASITRNIIESSANAIIALDENGAVSYMNKLAIKLFKNLETDAFLKELFPESLKASFEKDQFIESQLIAIDGVNNLVSVSFLSKNKRMYGGIVYITDSQKIIHSENKLRTQLHNSGHFAKNSFTNIIGSSPEISETIDWAKRIAQSENNILINGETGTGKELFAQSIHNFSKRKGGPFIAINCAALSTSLLESELFGYEKGSFTGANNEGKLGIFELAHNGTVFLDEIGEISGDLQAKLLRVIQEKEVVRVGGNNVIPVDVRIISATNKHLKQLAKAEKFRSDLYYRLAVLELKLPALAERKTDIPLIIENYLKMNYPNLRVAAADLTYFENFPYDGNIRQLINMIERCVVLTDGDKISRFTIEKVCNDEFVEESSEVTLENPANDFLQGEKYQIEQSLKKNWGNRQKTAQELGISTTTLWRKMKHYNL